MQADPKARSGRMDADLRRWKDACNKWIRLLWVGNYEVTFQVFDEPVDNQRPPNGGAEFVTVATASVRPEYFRALLSIARSRVRDCTDEELDENACHEVMHIVVSPFADAFYELIEAIPKARGEGWTARRMYEHERVTSHLTTVV